MATNLEALQEPGETLKLFRESPEVRNIQFVIQMALELIDSLNPQFLDAVIKRTRAKIAYLSKQ